MQSVCFRRLYSDAPIFIPRATFPNYNVNLSDFKGHQRKATVRIVQLIPQINLLLELRDGRAPLSSRNVLFDQLARQKQVPRLILYTNLDRTPQSTLQTLNAWHRETNDSFMMLDTRSPNEIRNLLSAIKSFYDGVISDSGLDLPLGFRVLVGGVPNVGKSTLINGLRATGGAVLASRTRRKVARTGDCPGITTATSECIRVANYRAGIYVHDTPGISLPARLSSPQRTLALALCGCIGTSLVDPFIQADYLLYLMNLQASPSSTYGEYTDQKPTNDIYRILDSIKRRTGVTSDTAAALHWISRWRQGRTATITLDVETLFHNSDTGCLKSFSYKDHVTKDLRDAIPLPTPSRNIGAARARNSNQLFRR